MIQVTLYSRRDCHLCDDVKAELDRLQAEFPHTLDVIDIDVDKKLARTYGEIIPVVKIGPYTLQAPITSERLRISLAAARDRETHRAAVEETYTQIQAHQNIGVIEKISYWLSKHYLLVFNIFVFVYIGLPFLAPVLMRSGVESPARLIYRAYSIMCHQLAFRSVFLFGDQPVYPKAAAHVDTWLTYEEVINPDSQDLIAARDFLGNPATGYKVALCERDLAIYLGILFFGITFSFARQTLKPLPWYVWVALGMFPMAVDGFSQLFSQLSIPWLQILLPYRESTPTLRYITGALFGITTAWFGYPLMETSMRETRGLFERKYARLEKYRKSGQTSQSQS